MLACADFIGAIHSIVFAGFSDALVPDCGSQAKVVITVDGGGHAAAG
jgi:acyl-coenzyme A synthetase/AMP-(fatty) acid ligase